MLVKEIHMVVGSMAGTDCMGRGVGLPDLLEGFEPDEHESLLCLRLVDRL